MGKSQARALDKFYTLPREAERGLARVAWTCARLGVSGEEALVVEPSAGSGAFLRKVQGLAMPRGMDIAPEGPGIVEGDFLRRNIQEQWGGRRESTVVVGNPPFGKRGRLAAAFLEASLRQAVVVGFVLPIIFRKYSTQRLLPPQARLLWDMDMPEEAFVFEGAPYAVRCCFQVWTTLPVAQCGYEDLRRRTAPDRAHPDFRMWQYNVTPQTRRYFDEDWDIAVLRQGYGDHNRHWTKGEELSLRKQWILFQASTPEVLQRLRAIDFNALACTNTSVRGFGKAEVVAQYRAQFEGAVAQVHPQSWALERGVAEAYPSLF